MSNRIENVRTLLMAAQWDTAARELAIHLQEIGYVRGMERSRAFFQALPPSECCQFAMVWTRGELLDAPYVTRHIQALGPILQGENVASYCVVAMGYDAPSDGIQLTVVYTRQ